MTYTIDHGGASYAVDVLAAYAVTRVTQGGTSHDAHTTDLPDDFRDRIARQLAEDWAAQCETRLVEPSEIHLARHIVHALLPDPGGDERGVDRVLRALWTQNRAAA